MYLAELRGICPENSNLLGAPSDVDHDRVAVDHAFYGCIESRRDPTAGPPTPPGAPEQGDGERRARGPGTDHVRTVAIG